MPQPIPTVSISISGKSEEIKLTRRRMLSMLFGYLAFLALLLYFVSIGAQVMAPSAKAIVAVWLHGSIVASFLGIFFFLVGQLIFITMFGLYQLSDRMHQPD